jgi:aspartyl-tRNA(Asn)/glutamyl-tRNA(Gln) amidotransferase subunit A
VADAALALDVMAYYEPEDPFCVRSSSTFLSEIDRGVRGLRVAWSADLGYAPVDPEVRNICEAAAKRFADAGCDVEEATPGFASPAADGTFMGVAAASDAVWLTDLLTDDDRKLIDEPAKFFLDYGRKLSGMDVVRANQRRMTLWQTMREFHQKYDLLLSPVMSCTAFPIGQPPAQVAGQTIPPMGWMGFTQPFNLNGAPAASVPCGFDSQGMPVGLQIVGRAYEDATVLRAARAFEQLSPWAQHRPKLAS